MRRIAHLCAILLLLVLLLTLLHKLIMPQAGVAQLSRAEVKAVHAGFVRLLAGDGRSSAEALGRIGLGVRRVDQPFPGFIVDERKGEPRGQGAYLIRHPGTEPDKVLISAPHRGADLHTGPLALALFNEMKAAAAAWNSAPRRNGPDSAGADIARLERHAFTAFSRAFAEVHPGGRIVQLHGFDPGKRETRAGRQADIILSSGSDRPSRSVRRAAACLAGVLPGYSVRIFPTQVSELGGLANAQAAAVRPLSEELFIHIELSRRMREDLVVSDALRSMFGDCMRP